MTLDSYNKATSIEGGVAGDRDVFGASSLLIVVLGMIGGALITSGGGGSGRR